MKVFFYVRHAAEQRRQDALSDIDGDVAAAPQ